MTILGQHSATETKDLLKAKDGEMADLAKAFSSFGPKWQAADPKAYSAWLSDYNALKAAYSLSSAEAKAQIALAEMTPFISDDNLPTETGYQAIISSLQKTPGAVSPGDFQDVFDRIQASLVSQGLPQYVESPVAQPTKGSDTDLNTLQAANAVINKLPSASTMNKGVVIAVCAGLGIAAITALKFLANPLGSR